MKVEYATTKEDRLELIRKVHKRFKKKASDGYDKYLHYNDVNDYFQEHFGDVYNETTRHDNDWD